MPACSCAGVATMLTLPCDMTACPPNTEDMSITVTFAPLRPSSSAADSPEIPAPTTTTSAAGLDGKAGLSDGRCESEDSDRPELAATLVGAAGEQPPSGSQITNDAMARKARRRERPIW